MKVSLKDLKKNKGQKKELNFLTPLTELIEKEYKEILDSFTKDNYGEAIEEILQKYTYSAVYDTPEKICFTGKYSSRHDLYFIEKKKENKVTPDNLTIHLYGLNKVAKDALENYDGWGTISNNYKLTEIYIVTDKKAFEEYALDEMVKYEELRIKELKEEEEREREELKTHLKHVELYGKDYKDNRHYRTTIKLLEALNKGTEKEKFEAVSEAVEHIIDELEDRNW